MGIDPSMIPNGLDRVPSHWCYFQLQEVCEGVIDCPHSTPTLSEVGPLMVRTQDVLGGVFRADNAAHVTEDTYVERISRAEPQFGDLLYSREGTYFGIAAEVPPDTRVCLGQRMVLIRPDLERLNSRYLRFWLNSPQLSSHVHGFRDGSVAERLNMSTIRSLPVAVPPLSEQAAIADILGALDDKIEQNRRTARALERLARAIFRAWFVDFEPVKAKAAGATAFPSLPQPVFDALPTRFTDSEIGPVPEGWEVKALSDACEVNPKRALRKGEITPCLEMKNMPTKGHAPETWTERPFGSGMRFINGDTLVARITPCLENGKTAFVDFLHDGQIAWGSTEYIVLRPRPPLPPNFAYCLARTNEFRDFAIQNMTGTSGRQRVAPTVMEHFQTAMPSETAAAGFGEIVQPLFESVRAGMDESRKLAGIRDYLLPKLLSGEVRVHQAEAAVAESV